MKIIAPKHLKKVLITQQIQKQASMDRLEEDCNGLNLWVFENLLDLSSFSKFIFAVVIGDINKGTR